MSSVVSHLNQMEERRFGPLLLREIFPHYSLGDVNIIHEFLPRNTTLPTLRHNRTRELVYCLSGNFDVVLNGVPHRLGPNHLLWIPPKTWHSFITEDEEARALSIFSPRFDLSKEPDVEFPTLAT